MGCSASRSRQMCEGDFYKETRGYELKKTKGLCVEDGSLMETNKVIGTSSKNFQEEIIEHATESGSVKPWLTNVVPPEHEIEEDMACPKYSLKIEHIFGYRIEDCRENLFFIAKDQLLYISSTLGIIQNIDDNTQILFGGFESTDERECHDNDIMSLAYLEGDVSMVATGQRGMKPMILVWSPFDTSVVYAKFSQPRGSKEVAAVCFDKEGHYLASFGKDEKNSFYVFDLHTKTLIWTQETGNNKNEFLLDLAFNPTTSNEICVIGVNKIIFGYLSNKGIQKVVPNYPDLAGLYFTAVDYMSKGICVIGSNEGHLITFVDNKKQKHIKLSAGSIQNLTYADSFKQLYASDNIGNVYIIQESDMKVLDKFKMNAVVKAIDINEEGDIAMGMRSGEIVIKHYQEPTKREVSFLKSHNEGSITGLDFIPDKYAVTTGEDNQILVWNLRTHSCIASGMINAITSMSIRSDNPGSLSELSASNKSNGVSYNRQKGHIAVGVNDGSISIRKGMKDLNRLRPDITIGKGAVSELKYTLYGDLLIVCCESGEVTLLDVNEDYLIKKTVTLPSYIVNFDWDQSNKYIQAVTKDNCYNFYDSSTLTVIGDPLKMRSVEWPQFTCKFGYTVQGVYMGSTDPEFITAVCKAHHKKLILSGDDDLYLNLYNYPTVSENPSVMSYNGHAGHIKRIVFSNDDSKILTIAEEDKAIILWSLEAID